ncbi:MAG: aminotransferase class I/II-fold pyridoxal phosphate-dependent enzyme [Candidatus Coatesbacteria bacterium]|nr:aminotransferase class I/II-fold pyridoxal phosphate-dependent enzyme [Candidatus Coatesbacteria bacterium]
MQASKRVLNMPTYVFAAVDEIKFALIKEGVDVIDFGIGNPDQRPPKFMLDALHRAIDDEKHQNHRYSQFMGIIELRKAVADWYKRRFNVTLDPETEILPLVGSKEGLLCLYLAYLDKGETALIPSPCYPAHIGAARVAEADIQEMGLLEENKFLPDLDAIAPDVARRAKFLLFNYPNNPTGAEETREFYEKALEFGIKHNTLLISDIAYSELSMEPDYRPMSFLELPDAKKYAVEFYSCSKSYNMPGWRVGFLVGNSEVIANTLKIKTAKDFSIFLAVQRAIADILNMGEDFARPNAELYRKRRDRLVQHFRAIGWDVPKPKAGMYIWTRIPKRFSDSMTFVKELAKRTGVIVSPGSGFGGYGEGFVRMALVVDEDRVEEAAKRIADSGILG